MQHNLDDIGGARELAMHRISVAKEQLETAKEVVELVERYLKTLDEK